MQPSPTPDVRPISAPPRVPERSPATFSEHGPHDRFRPWHGIPMIPWHYTEMIAYPDRWRRRTAYAVRLTGITQESPVLLRTPRFSLVQAALIRLFTAAVLIVAALANVPRVIVPDAVNAAEAAPPSVVQPASPILPMVAQSSAPSDTSTATTAAAAPAAAIEPTAAWVKTNREAALWSGWDAQAKQFSTVAPDMTLQVIEIRGARAYVYFPGDKKGHPAGN